MSALFTPETFDFFDGIARDPTKTFYSTNREAFREFVDAPFRLLFRRIVNELPATITDLLDTKRDLFSRIPKNDFGRGGAWDFYWAAVHAPGESRIQSPQLYLSMDRNALELGFAFGTRGTEYEERFLKNLEDNETELEDLLSVSFQGMPLTFGSRELDPTVEDLTTWFADPAALGLQARRRATREELLRHDLNDLVLLGVETFKRLFPLMILALLESPMTAVRSYLDVPEVGQADLGLQPAYSLAACAADTHLPEEQLATWTRAIDRHGQAIVYGPPGTGKTFVSEHLARHLVGGNDGFTDLVQFHPAYSYEDFMQGIRPSVTEEGSLDYSMVPGRFMEFCRRADLRTGPCVLIIDEINRANLARVFGELMYLMEYRGRWIPLAGGERFGIPENVRILGTMNTADRSIALVDHALRRRFAFLALYPDFDVLRAFHRKTGYDPDPLIAVLTSLNSAIGDRHYEIGISFFMRPGIEDELPDIWRTQIEPYLEEYFFDQPAKVEAFRWAQVQSQLRAP
jgi:5-methylcytosine-specific restriction protein B